MSTGFSSSSKHPENIAEAMMTTAANRILVLLILSSQLLSERDGPPALGIGSRERRFSSSRMRFVS
ncbi:MAG: hypothetical protein KF901_02280 [Myxococcales bacterium]|nr:hypothetical protein [Myxococcales bacterium]